MIMKRLERMLFNLYMLFLPFEILSPFLLNFKITGVIQNNSAFIEIIGIILMSANIILFRKKIKLTPLLKKMFAGVMLLNITSIIMAFLLHEKFGILFGEDTYRAISGNIVFYTLLPIGAIWLTTSIKNESLLNVKKYLNYFIFIELIVGYVQIFIINGFKIILPLYNFLADSLGLFVNSGFLVHRNQISLTGTEPSSVGIILGVMIFPYILTQITVDTSKLLQFILFLPIVFFSKSSTAYIAIVVNLVLFILFNRVSVKLTFKKMITTYFIGSAFFVTLITLPIYYNGEIANQIYSLIFEKTTSQTNLSTVFRQSSVINDLEVFKKYPIFGIGNGNQGFLYASHLPSWIMSAGSEEVRNALSGGNGGVQDGGPFLPAFLSGYGLLGFILLMVYLAKTVQLINISKEELEYLRPMYFIGGGSFLILSTMATGLPSNMMALFIISIPFMGFCNHMEDPRWKIEDNIE